MRNLWIGTLLIAGGVILSGCSDNPMQEEVEKVKKEISAVDELEKSLEEEQQKILDELDTPVEEALEELPKEERTIMDTAEVKELPAYEDGDELALFVADILFQFQSGNLSPEDYYDFLVTHSIESRRENLNEGAIESYKSIQEQLTNTEVEYIDYEVSEVTYDSRMFEGYFYRKIKTNEDDIYYITTIAREDDHWKFSDDRPSDRFIESSTQNNETNESEE